jgi:hypothetical protein
MADPMINVNKFRSWHENKDTDYFLSFINLKTQKLSKDAVCKEAGFGYSALKPKNGNPILIKEFQKFEISIITRFAEKGLIAQSIAATQTNTASKKEEVSFDQNARQNVLNARRVAQLEKENMELKDEIKQLESRLKSSEEAVKVVERHRESIEVLNEVNCVP